METSITPSEDFEPMKSSSRFIKGDSNMSIKVKRFVKMHSQEFECGYDRNRLII